jgi:hypothetical protein
MKFLLLFNNNLPKELGMKKALIIITFLLILPSIAMGECQSCGNDYVSISDNLEPLLNALETDLGQKIINTIVEQGEMIDLKEAKSLSIPPVNAVITFIESEDKYSKVLAYFEIHGREQFLIVAERKDNELYLYFPSGKTIVINGSEVFYVEKLVEQFQEFDDLDNSTYFVEPEGGIIFGPIGSLVAFIIWLYIEANLVLLCLLGFIFSCLNAIFFLFAMPLFLIA